MIFKFGRGFIKSIAILLGIMIGTGVSAFFGLVDFSAVGESSWFHLPKVFYLGMPEFHLAPILTMILVAIVSLVESTGVYFALGDITDKELDEEDLKRGTAQKVSPYFSAACSTRSRIRHFHRTSDSSSFPA